MIKWVFTIVIISSFFIDSSAQRYTGEFRYLKRGTLVVDSIAVVQWPEFIPQYAIMDLDAFIFADPADRVGERLVIPLMKTMDPANRSHVGIYYAPTKNRIAHAQLYKSGAGVWQLKVPLDRPGYYFAIAINKNYAFARIYHYDGVGVYKHADYPNDIVMQMTRKI